MALYMMPQSWLLLSLFFVSILTCHCQINNSPQNIETFFPNETSAPGPATQQPKPPRPSEPTQKQDQGPVATPKSTSSNGKIAKAVAATAASTIVLCGLIFFLIQRCLRSRRRKEITNTASGGDGRVVPQGNVFERIDGNVKGLIVDEDGLDVIYWRKLEGKNSNIDLHKEVASSPKNKEKEDDHHDLEENQVKKSKSIQEIPLLRGKSSTSHLNIPPGDDEPYKITRIPPPPSASTLPPTIPSLPASVGVAIKGVQKPDSPTESSTPPPPASPSTPPSTSFSAVPKMSSSTPARPPPPMPERKSPAAPPAPPPIPARMSPAPPPPPPSSKSRPASVEMPVIKQRNSSGKGMPDTSSDQVKLKPLHWDKVNTNADHSMVWDKVDRGSFRVDQDLMEALFGYVATNRRSPKGKSHSTIPRKDESAPAAKIFLLDPRKSQNIAIILKSLAVSQSNILDALIDGKGLNADTLEKLSRVSPTEEEQSLILEYKGDPERLAAAESFLHRILKAVPSAFKRLNAMLFRLNYDYEIQEIKESLQTIELGCKEMKSKGLFVKLLEAVLKAGNRMNAGTARGNAQAFNLASLRKLSDVKSTNGKTTLLHFVVEEVVRSEGKRIARNHIGNLSRSSSRSSNDNENYESNAASNEQIAREHVTLGLPIVGGISSEFSNVKKAAQIDYSNLVGSISALSTRLVEIQELVSKCGSGEAGYFVKEMGDFIGNAREELKFVRDKQASVMQLIKKTTQYYQGGASKDTAEDSLQLFVIVKDFLGMVDQTCIEIARDMQKRKTPKAISG
ncbi:formin-like protein 8 isoform X1 [Abrus precatorius]|uniref:Formin-like protein n=1 Tax=Abrus precatorius TaxID=3816 RepID=A0A8B8KQZ6_ABRPR|nr:formin-like protein 8 isoform X1 [Abrus precatorius]